MIGGAVGWLALDVARPRWLAGLGGGLAVLGHVVRIGVSVLLIVSPTAAVDSIIAASIVPMFVGMILLGIATLIGKNLPARQAWAPLLTVAAGFVAAGFYSVDKVVHFALLGLLWGLAWMFVASVILTRTRTKSTA